MPVCTQFACRFHILFALIRVHLGMCTGTIRPLYFLIAGLAFAVFNGEDVLGQTKAAGKTSITPAKLNWPPTLPGNVSIASGTSPTLLNKPATVKLQAGTMIATTAPRVDFLYFPGQTYHSRLWSNWGDGSTQGNIYYTSIGDHDAPRGNAQVYEYNADKKELRLLIDVKKFMEEPGNLPEGMDYIPGKIHGRTEMGSDGWVYFSTHRGSTRDNTTDKRGYKGDWIFRVHPVNGKKEIVASYPMPKHTIPASVLDPKRMIFYGGTAPGNDAPEKQVWFIAYDIQNKKTLKRVEGGFDRYAIFSSSTGNVYWATAGSEKKESTAKPSTGWKYNPATNAITSSKEAPAVRACTQESRTGLVYGFSQGDNDLWSFDVRSEKLNVLGPAMVATQTYVTSIDLDPKTERYLYYVPGAHGGSRNDGTPVVQYDLKTGKRKVLAFLHDYLLEKYGYSAVGTYSTALNADGSLLFITWNGTRIPGARNWDTAALTVIHIPASERQP